MRLPFRMRPSAPDCDSPSPVDPVGTGTELAQALTEFLAHGQSERAFAEIVASFGGAVYHSSLRRCGDPFLAEEVSQNVFAILARKARTVARHPAPLAWLFRTTKLEAAKAMRREHRQRRKQAALASEQLQAEAQSATVREPGTDPWRDALPLLDASLDELAPADRELVLQRFIHERKFKDLAAKNGQSVAACKMRLRRTLDRLAHLLRSRGVTLSTATLASLLASEMTRAAPPALAASAGKILATSQSLATGTIIANTIHTMSTAKSATLTAVAVVILATGPVAWQHSQARSKQDDLTVLERQHEQLRLRSKPTASSSTLGKRMNSSRRARTVREILSHANSALDPERFIYELTDAINGQDTLGMMRLFLAISQMSEEELSALNETITQQQAPESLKRNALRMLAEFSGSKDHRQKLENSVQLGVDHYTMANQLAIWASEEPEEALAWYRSNMQSGRLSGKGVHDAPEGVLLGSLLSGIASKNTDLALELFAEASPQVQRETAHVLADSFVGLKNGRDHIANIESLLEGTNSDMARMYVVLGATQAVQRRKDLDAAVAFLDHFQDELTLADRGGALGQLASGIGDQQRPDLAAQADWLYAQLGPEADAEMVSAAMDGFIRPQTWRGTPGLSDWIESQPPGLMRDMAWKTHAVALTHRESHRSAMQSALRIEDADTRRETLQEIADHLKRLRTPEAQRNFEEAGLDPADYGFEGTESPATQPQP